ncbi:STAS/SEC14 domain-containing protein [Paenarthrobacter sp. Z7-10]|uniref:DUF7793 family protein n=1 Tax=Paenarthrobacter sp. Z7-10 TaxID=2787635 RepID=UPI0022A994E1|nr:STAS/SEC14 domain-containing protein [Paenarthrobacter sp. Z7-10]MCZ2404898.1 STAS/SEC14 domain-containing protein [Paenarthrobacter sp. Z7-10]
MTSAPADVPESAAPSATGSSLDAIRVWLSSEGIIRVKLPENAAITGEQARTAGVAVRSLAEGQLHPLILDLTGVDSVTTEVRNVYANSTVVSAFALLGAGPVDRVIAHHFLGAESVGVPAEFFTSEPAAISWLQEQ